MLLLKDNWDKTAGPARQHKQARTERFSKMQKYEMLLNLTINCQICNLINLQLTQGAQMPSHGSGWPYSLDKIQSTYKFDEKRSWKRVTWKKEREDPQQGKILIYCISGTWNSGSCTTGLIYYYHISGTRNQKININTLVLIFWLKLLPT